MKSSTIIRCFLLSLIVFGMSNCSAQSENMSDNAEHRQKWKEWREFQRDVRQYRSDDKQRSLIHQGRKRFYRVYVPPVYSDDYLFPVVFYLHGGGGNELNAEKMGLTKIADKYQFILVSPAGTGASNRLPFYVWNAGVWGEGECCGYAYEKKIDDVGFIRKILAEMKASYRIDKKSIYATGISNGGMMSYRLACEMSDVFAAIAPVAPPAVPEPCSPQPISVMHVIGDKDPCVKIEGGKVGGCLAKAMGMKQRIDFIARPSQYMIDRFVTNNECENLAFESSLNTEAHCVTYRGCKEEREVQYCTVKNMGHVWPGGGAYADEAIIGPATDALALDHIWQFFQRNAKL